MSLTPGEAQDLKRMCALGHTQHKFSPADLKRFRTLMAKDIDRLLFVTDDERNAFLDAIISTKEPV